MKTALRFMLVVLILALAIPTPGLAQDQNQSNPYDIGAESAQDLEPSNEDLSVRIIEGVAGENWYHAIRPGVEVETTIFQRLFKVFNGIVFLFAAILTTWVIIKGIISTSYEGVPLGSNLHSVWVPIRSALAWFFLMPMPWANGFSVLQGILLLFFGWSIGAANLVWANGVDFMTAGVIQQDGQAEMTKNNVKDLTESTARDMIRFLTYVEYFKMEEQRPYSGIQVSEENLEDPRLVEEDIEGVPFFEFTAVVGADYRSSKRLEDELGSIQIPCPSMKNENLPKKICVQRVKAIQDFIDRTEPIAAWLANQNSIVPETELGEVAGDLNKERANRLLRQAIQGYNNRVGEQVAKIVNEVKSSDEALNESAEEFRARAKQQGWASAGMWYWTLAAHFGSTANVAGVDPSYSGSDIEAIRKISRADMDPVIKSLDEFAGGEQMQQAQAKDLAEFPGGEVSGFEHMTHYLGLGFESINVFEDLPKRLTRGDPIANLKNYGDQIVSLYGGAAGIYATSVGTSAMIKKAGSAGYTQYLPGSGAVASGAAFTKEFLEIAWSTLEPILIPLFIAGLFLAYYLPSIPFILWFLGMISWVIMFIEALVAAPLWAASHSMPEGTGIAGQHAKAGYVLVLNVLVRPLLMIFGFLGAMLIFSGCFWFLGQAWMVFTESLTGAHSTGFISFAIFTILLTGIVVISAQKIFGLAVVLANRVPKWIGQQVQGFGEEQSEQKASGIFIASSQGASPAGPGSAGASLGGDDEDAGGIEAEDEESLEPELDRGDS